KDRIKDLSKEYFNQRMKKFLPDYDINMFYSFFDSEGKKDKKQIGQSKEFVRYLSREMVPPEINYVRDIGHRSELDPVRNEVILHYSKKTELDLQIIREKFLKINYIRDISRFNISNFLSKLDDPQKGIRYFNQEKNEIDTMNAPKVYHINIIFRYRTSFENEDNSKTSKVSFERIRLILNKKGIQRIEDVVMRNSISYCENR